MWHTGNLCIHIRVGIVGVRITGVGLAGVGIVGVGITGVGIAGASRLRRRSTGHNTVFQPPVNSSYDFGL